jgi:hypothetical protein
LQYTATSETKRRLSRRTERPKAAEGRKTWVNKRKEIGKVQQQQKKKKRITGTFEAEEFMFK